jgi:hypothetical protein
MRNLGVLFTLTKFIIFELKVFISAHKNIEYICNILFVVNMDLDCEFLMHFEQEVLRLIKLKLPPHNKHFVHFKHKRN